MTFWYRFFKTLFVRPIIKWWCRVEITGTENIPASGAILAGNHIDAGDTLALPAMVDRPMVFPAKKELFEGKDLKGRFVAWFLRAVGQAPIDRSGGRESVAGLGTVEEVLAAGGLIGIFPEGTRSPDGKLYKGHTGVARLALGHGCPVLPVGMINTRLVKNRLGIPTMRNARIIIGEPMSFSAFTSTQDEISTLRWVTNTVMGQIQEITGQEYVDVYASRVKHGKMEASDVAKHILPHPNHGVEPPLGDDAKE